MADRVKQFPSKRGGKVSADQAMSIWKRRKDSTGVDWKNVSATTLRAALQCIIASEAALTISAAQGGRGVMLKLWLGGQPSKEYANTAEEVNELLEDVIAELGSSSEDVKIAMAGGAD